MRQRERLYRPRPHEDFPGMLVAKLDVATNVVTYDQELLDPRNSRDLRFLRNLDEDEDELYLQQ